MDSLLTWMLLFVIQTSGGIVIDWLLAPERYDPDLDASESPLPALQRAVDSVRRL